MAARNNKLRRHFVFQLLFLLLPLVAWQTAKAADGFELAIPQQGSTLTSTTQTFSWQLENTGESWLYLGTSAGANDIHNSGSLGQSTSADISALPNDGRTIFLRLFYRGANQTWSHRDYTFQAHTGTNAIDLLSPGAGSTMTGTQQTFTWHGNGIDEWWLYLGSSTGSNDIYNSGNLGSVTSTTISALPHDGRTIYIRLFYRQTGAAWRHREFTLTAHTGDNAIKLLSPAPGASISNATQTFTWQGAGINEWWLYAGSSEGNDDLYNSGHLGSATSATVTSLPIDSSTLFVRLFYRQNNASWRYIDYRYSTILQAEQTTQATDLVALHYDIAPDLDDLQAIAAGANLSDKFGISPAVVIGAYGVSGQFSHGGRNPEALDFLYTSGTNMFGQGNYNGESRRQKGRQVADAAYGAGAYLDTGDGWVEAVNAQAVKFWNSLQNGYTVSVADGGPMDFTADVLKRLQSFHGATSEQLKRVMVVQHSLGFNVTNTTPPNRATVSNLATYVTIDNGNVGGNATANLEDSNTNTTTSSFAQWARNGNSKAAAWNSALDDFSAKIDFSDTVEYLYILDIPLSSVSDINSFSSFF